MTILDKFLEIAKSQMGVHEEKDHHSKMILEYHATTSLHATEDTVAWCSSFVNWVVEQSGEEGTKSAAAKSWLTWGKKLSYPTPGCIVVLKRTKFNVEPVKYHVGFFVGANGPYVTIRGGNQHDMVCDESWMIGSILDYRVPVSYEK